MSPEPPIVVFIVLAAVAGIFGALVWKLSPNPPQRTPCPICGHEQAVIETRYGEHMPVCDKCGSEIHPSPGTEVQP